MRRSNLGSIIFGVMLCTALLATSAVAKGPAGGGGGHEPPTEAANSLSVPAVFVPGLTSAPSLNFACGEAVDPATVIGNATTLFDAPLTPAPAGDYYVQGEDRWQAECSTALPETVLVSVAWGDNLAGAPLKVGTPIRVEVGLLVNDAALLEMTGFPVYKLTDELDRYATYGTRGAIDMGAAYAEVRAWDADATFSIVSSDGVAVVGPEAMTAEINATGRVVYGYNWRTSLADTYTITFNAPNVGIGTVDNHVHTISLEVVVTAVGGGGGGGHH